MNLADWTLRNGRTSVVLYAVVIALGLSSYFTLGQLEYPEFTIRNAQIVTRYPGRSALQVEQEVTEPLEQAIRQMAEVLRVTSTSKSGVSIVSVELHEHLFDLDPIWQRMRNKVNATRLPAGAGIPVVNDEFGDVFPFVYALRGDGFSDAELLDYAENLRDALLELDGVAKVEFHGEQPERIFVDVSSAELAARGQSPTNLQRQISDQNAIASSGSVEVGIERVSVATQGEFESFDEIRDLRLAVPGASSSIVLSDLADVQRGYEEPPRALARLNGERVLSIAVSMVSGRNVNEVGAVVETALAAMERELPIGLDIDRVFFQPQYVSQSVRSFLVNLAQAFCFVALVMFFFAGWRIALIVAILVPSAVLFAFAMMPAFDIQLEMMSIAALIIALGLLVDNAVVVSEQILVRLQAGEERRSACVHAVRGLTIPLLAASATTVAAFSPIALAEGAVSEFTYSLFAVVTLTLLSSWVLSLTIIPYLCFHILRPLRRDTPVGRALTAFERPYAALLRGALRRRWLFLLSLVVVTGVAAWGFRFVPSIFFPPNERGQFIANLELPLGTDILETEERVREMERWILDTYDEEVITVASWIGNGGPRWYLSLAPEAANPNYAFLMVLTRSGDPGDVRALINAVNEHALENYADTRVVAKPLENGPPVGDPIQIRLSGEDLRTLYACRDRVSDALKGVDGVVEIRDDWGAWVKQLTVDPDPVRAARVGLTTASIAAAIGIQYEGVVASRFREGDKSIPIVVRSDAQHRDRPDRIEDLPIYRGDATSVPLGQVADVSLDFLPGSILRRDTVRTMTVKAQVRGRFASAALAEIRPLVDELMGSNKWPQGYRTEFGGEQEESAKAQGKIGGAMPISLAILSLILIAQFNSLRRFGIILLTIPPMLCGVVPGLLVTGSSFGFMTLLGVIALLGIVVNNAILLIDAIDGRRKAGDSKDEAIRTAARSRLRPIIMTTTTTIIGLMPLAISGGGMWSSMANAMMFGLGFATVLTLVLCPVLFHLLFRDEECGAAS